MNPNIQSQLAAPGAGLPAIERFVGGLLFRIGRWTGTREKTNARFQRERAVIRGLMAVIPETLHGNRVLIERPRGLEDSSRYWSIRMTLDHLRIVHGEMSRVIVALGCGQSPHGEASTAAVKPSPEAGAAVVAAYEHSCDALMEAVQSVRCLKTPVRFAHPWFGPLDAAGWHTLAAGHMRIHRVQIERIRAALALSDNSAVTG